MTDTDFTLYHGLASTCSKKVRMTLYEKGLKFESRLMNLQAFEQHQPEYLAINPNGVVPSLVDDGVPVTESSIIMEYIDERYPDSTLLMPSDVLGRAKVRLWLKFSDNVAFDSIFLSTWSKLSVSRAQSLSKEELQEVVSRIPTKERRDRWGKIAKEGYSADEIKEAIDKMVGVLDAMEAGLVPGPWLVGDMFTLADIANIPYLDRIRTLHPDLLPDGKYPRIQDWETRMRQRPAFDQAYDFQDDPRVKDLPKL